MKKYLVWIGAAVLVMALASPSMAQFRTWGHLEIESYWDSNISLNRDLTNANYQGVGMRYRFNLGYGDPKTVMAVLGFEANSRGFGETPSDSGAQVIPTSFNPAGTQPVIGNAGSVSLAGKTGAGDWGTDTIGLYVRHAYLDFTIPNTPLTMQVGMQNVVIGGFLGRFFFNKDVPAFFLNGNFAPSTLSAFWLKGVKQNYYMDNDLDFYGLLYRLKQPTVNVEAWFVYANDRRSVVDTFALYRQAGATSNVPAATTSYPTTTTAYNYYITEVITPRGYEQKPWWLGGNVPMVFGNLKIEPTAIYLGGKFSDAVNGQNPNVTSNADFNAYLGDLTISYRLGPGLSFLVEGFYATGHDGTKNTYKGDTENQWMSPGVNADGTENRNVFGNGWSVFYFSNTELSYYACKQIGIGGHAFGRANVEYNPFAWLNLNANYLYIVNTANKYVGHINGIDITNPNSSYASTAVTTGFKADGTPNTPAGVDVSKSYIGSELNLIAKIAIYKDFLYKIGFGYFFPGDVYNIAGGGVNPMYPNGKTADQGWALLTNLMYVF
jgi:hypothetical protein